MGYPVLLTYKGGKSMNISTLKRFSFSINRNIKYQWSVSLFQDRIMLNITQTRLNRKASVRKPVSYANLTSIHTRYWKYMLSSKEENQSSDLLRLFDQVCEIIV